MRLFKWIVEFTIKLKMFFRFKWKYLLQLWGRGLHVTAVPHLRIYTISTEPTSPC